MRKIIDYIAAGVMSITILGGTGYMLYDTIKNKTLTEKGFNATCVTLGAATLGLFYGGARAIEEALEETRPEEENEKSEGELEKGVKE